MHEIGDKGAAAAPSIIRQEFNLEYQYYIATLDQPLKQDTIYVLVMNYIGFLNEDLKGFYRSSYTNDDGDTV